MQPSLTKASIKRIKWLICGAKVGCAVFSLCEVYALSQLWERLHHSSERVGTSARELLLDGIGFLFCIGFCLFLVYDLGRLIRKIQLAAKFHNV